METAQGIVSHSQSTSRVSSSGNNVSVSTTYIALFRLAQRQIEFSGRTPLSISDGDSVAVAGRSWRGTLYADAIRNSTTGVVTHSGIVTRIIVALFVVVIGAVIYYAMAQFYWPVGAVVCLGLAAGAAYLCWRASQTSNALRYVEAAVPMIHARRMTARLDGPFCVFLIGHADQLPVENPPVAPHRARHAANAGGTQAATRTRVARRACLVRSNDFDASILAPRSRRSPSTRGVPIWLTCRPGTAFGTRRRQWLTVGIFHETYRVEDGNYEVIYHNMPPFGLGEVGKLEEIGGRYHTAAGRMGR